MLAPRPGPRARSDAGGPCRRADEARARRAARAVVLAAQRGAYERAASPGPGPRCASCCVEPADRERLAARAASRRSAASATVERHRRRRPARRGAPTAAAVDASVGALVDRVAGGPGRGAAVGRPLTPGRLAPGERPAAWRSTGLADVAMSELVALGVQPDCRARSCRSAPPGTVTVQAYEYTGGLAAGDPVAALGTPLSARLGPELLGGVFDGLLRPLSAAPTWLEPDSRPARHATGTWAWQPGRRGGRRGRARGRSSGRVPGAEGRRVPRPGAARRSRARGPGLAPTGTHRSRRAGSPWWRACRSGSAPSWPVRRPRPVRERLATRGAAAHRAAGARRRSSRSPGASSAAVPGGFGTGKTMLLQQIAKWCDADVIVYVGCGERGNEMADVLAELSRADRPPHRRRLAERTVIIANTSNMPMMAREASIYTGVTVAEYFRDMGHDAVVIADSTSRWAEALREFASRSGALPAEEGYPADLASALAAFYERAGTRRHPRRRRGRRSPSSAPSRRPGGDITEPVTAHTERFVRGAVAPRPGPGLRPALPGGRLVRLLLPRRRGSSRSLVRPQRRPGRGRRRRARMAALLAEADRLGDLAELVGTASLPGHERVVLLGGRLLREAVLQQSALSPRRRPLHRREDGRAGRRRARRRRRG